MQRYSNGNALLVSFALACAKSISLPSSIHVRLGDYVSVELDTDKPYTYHSDHVKRYPPGQKKKKNKKKYKWG